MKIIVCIKQVPDTKGGVKFNPDGTLDRGAMLTIMNPDDKAGLEAALRIKDATGAEVTVITMGLPKAADGSKGLPQASRITFGIFVMSLPSLLPLPPARIRAFIVTTSGFPHIFGISI